MRHLKRLAKKLGIKRKVAKPATPQKYLGNPKFMLLGDHKFHATMAGAKIWMTKDGVEIPYEKLETGHLTAILNMLQTQDTNRHAHLDGIKAEFLRRATDMGKVLYEI